MMWLITITVKNRELSIERINYLKSIGFVWKFRDFVPPIPWIEMYDRLVAYKQCHQSTMVPQKYTEDPTKWVGKQRQTYSKGRLSEKRMELLQSIDFVWWAK